MKVEKTKIIKQKFAQGVTINPSLNGKYNNEPLFKEKIDMAKSIVKKAGIPKF